MKLGDFFTSAPHARPVNPRPVTFTAVAKGDILPGGARNPHKKAVAAAVTGAFAFLAGDGAEECRAETKRYLREREREKQRDAYDDADFFAELTYQVLQRVLREWDAQEQRAGGPLFETVDVLRELVVPTEADRVLKAYNQYVRDEHPEVVDDATFRGAQERGASASKTLAR